jgi:hypothetical protein
MHIVDASNYLLQKEVHNLKLHIILTEVMNFPLIGTAIDKTEPCLKHVILSLIQYYTGKPAVTEIRNADRL